MFAFEISRAFIVECMRCLQTVCCVSGTDVHSLHVKQTRRGERYLGGLCQPCLLQRVISPCKSCQSLESHLFLKCSHQQQVFWRNVVRLFSMESLHNHSVVVIIEAADPSRRVCPETFQRFPRNPGEESGKMLCLLSTNSHDSWQRMKLILPATYTEPTIL